jgi:trehalose 6-phosphate phosphatase
MEFHSQGAQRRYDDLVALAPEVVVGLDFDGTLSPIVDDPAEAFVHPDGPHVLADLARAVRAVVVVTGRPADQAVELGRLTEVADALDGEGTLEVFGQYGNQRWNTTSRTVTSAEPPRGLDALRGELPHLLEIEHAKDAYVEEKGLAIAVHTRRLPDPEEAFVRLEEALADAAERHGLVLEPGKRVLEVRAPGMHKGLALRTALDEHGAGGVLFAGDDLGDLEAFEAVRDLADHGFPTLLVCSSSHEEEVLVHLSDVLVDGPGEMVQLLASYVRDAAGRPA